jgi:ATPase family AAA domain-containing protein 3A/B
MLLCCYEASIQFNQAYPFWQTDHAPQRRLDAELVKMQEPYAPRREEARRATERKILEEMICTENEKAEID